MISEKEVAEMVRIAVNRQEAIKDAQRQLGRAQTLTEYWNALTRLCQLTEGKFIR